VPLVVARVEGHLDAAAERQPVEHARPSPMPAARPPGLVDGFRAEAIESQCTSGDLEGTPCRTAD
jgi:hypothetical protein